MLAVSYLPEDFKAMPNRDGASHAILHVHRYSDFNSLILFVFSKEEIVFRGNAMQF